MILENFQKAHREWVEAGLSGDIAGRDDRWSESLAVGSEGFVEQVKMELGFRAQHRQVAIADGLYTLREPVPPYGDHFDMENEPLRPNNIVPWQTNLETTEAETGPTPTSARFFRGQTGKHFLIVSLTASDHSGFQAQELLLERQNTVHDVGGPTTSVASRVHFHSTGTVN